MRQPHLLQDDTQPVALIRPVLLSLIILVATVAAMILISVRQLDEFAIEGQIALARQQVPSTLLSPENVAAILYDRGFADAHVLGPADRDPRAVVDLVDHEGRWRGAVVFTPFLPGSRILNETITLKAGLIGAAALLVLAMLARVQIKTRQLAQRRALAREQALTDSLSGLANRVRFEHQLALAHGALSTEQGRGFALYFIDLDRFKAVNDTYGHAAGDSVIRAAALRLSALGRPGDTIARLSGDEFAFIRADCGSEGEALAFADRLVAAFDEPVALPEARLNIGVSIGIAQAGPNTLAEALCQQADLALYEAKGSGRNRAVLFRETLALAAQERRLIEDDLRAALYDGRQLSLAYQPQFLPGALKPHGAEALLRWTHPVRGPIPPAEFLPVAERAGLMPVLGELVLNEALRFAKRHRDLTIALNISVSQLVREGFDEDVVLALNAAGVTPDRLELEVTEAALTEPTAGALRTLETLRQAGISLALDNFGTGHSSLTQLQGLKFDRIKLDRSFVRQADGGRDGRAMVQSMTALAHALGLKVTAEGIENESQLSVLEAAGCDAFQGYLFARPLTEADFDGLYVRPSYSAVA